MKKVLVTMAALGLVAGVATTASAVEWKMSGKYKVEGAYLSDGDGQGLDLSADTAASPNGTDAYFLHTFETNVDMKVNDKVSMNALVRLADDTFWGGQTNGDLNASHSIGNGATANSTNGDVFVKHLSLWYTSPIGKFNIGRVLSGPYGTDYLNKDSRADRIRLDPSFLASGPWSTMFYMDKVTDSNIVNTAEATAASGDEDSTTYVARLYYKTADVDSGIHYAYAADKTAGQNDNNKQTVIAYGKFKMDNYFANAELTHNFGDATATTDYDSWAGMLQVGGKFGNLTPSVMYFYAQGDESSTDGDVENYLGSTGTGDLFEPLYILTGRHTGLLNNDIASGETTNMSMAGVQAFVLAADYKVSDALTLHGAIGYAEADEEKRLGAGYDDEYGWEYNLGAAYKLLDNLTYEAHFGYLDTGDYFKAGVATADTENVYVLSHSLTMTF